MSENVQEFKKKSKILKYVQICKKNVKRCPQMFQNLKKKSKNVQKFKISQKCSKSKNTQILKNNQKCKNVERCPKI